MMKDKIILLVLLVAVMSTVLVTGCVNTQSNGGDEIGAQGNENDISNELDSVWLNDTDDVSIGDMV